MCQRVRDVLRKGCSVDDLELSAVNVLPNVSQLVGQQRITIDGVRREVTMAKDNVLSDGIRLRFQVRS